MQTYCSYSPSARPCSPTTLPPPPPEKLAENTSTQDFPAIDQTFNSTVTDSNTNPLIADATANTNPESKAEIEEITVTGQAAKYPGGQVTRSGRIGLLGNKDIFDTPFSISSYTAELIENQQARTVGDVVRNDASARLNSAGQGFFETITIRGFNVGDTNSTLYDGLPNLTSNRSTVQTLDRVEVFKGPNALLNGISGNVGGVINMVPKRPTDTPLTRFTADYDYQSRLGIHADLSRRFGSKKQFGARLNALYRNGEAATEGIGETFGEAALALEYRGDRLKLETILDYSDRELRRGDQFFFLSRNATAAPPAPDLGNAIQQPWEKVKQKAARGLLRAEYALGRDWEAYAAYGALGYEDYTVRTSGRNLGARGDFNPRFDFFPSKDNNSAWNAGIRGRLETFGVTHQLSMETMRTKGVYRFSKNQRFSSLNITSNLYKPVFFARPAFDDSIGAGANSVKTSIHPSPLPTPWASLMNGCC